MARIIGEAGVRLRADGKGLAAEMRLTLTKALKEATVNLDVGFGDAVRKDAEKTEGSVTGIFRRIAGAAQGAAGGLLSAATSGAKLALIGTKAGVALAGVSSLVTGIVGLIGVLGQAAGALGLLPAAFLAVKAGAATLQLGLTGVSDAFAAVASGDAAALQESLKNLAPSARSFVTEVAKVKPAFDQMRLATQAQLFDGLSKSIQPLAKTFLPIAQEMFVGIAETANRAGKGLAEFALEADTVGRVRDLTGNITDAFRELVPAIKPVVSAFLDIGNVGSSFLPDIADKIGGIATRFGEFIRSAADSGQLTAFFQNAIDVVGQLFQVFKNVGGILSDVFSAADTAGGGFLNSLVAITGSVREFTQSFEGASALTGFFTSMRDIVSAILPIFLQLAGVIGTSLAPILADLARTIGPAFAPLVDALGPALEAARPGIQALASGLASILKAAAPLLGVVGQLANVFGRTLGVVFEKLAPVIEQVATVLGDSLGAILPQLEPVLVQVAEAVAQVFSALVPLIPVFFQLIAAVLPLLPPLLQLVQAVIPPLLSLVQALVPIVVSLAQVFAGLLPPITAIVETILNILIPPIQLIAEIIGVVAGLVADHVGAISNVITTVFSAISNFITGIWSGILGVFRDAVRNIGEFVRGGFNTIRDTIGNVLGSIRDAVSTGISNVIGFFRELPGKVLGFLGDIARDAFNAGVNIVQGIINGIGNLAGKIKDKLLGMVKDAWNSVLDFFGISSPSKLAEQAFRDVGRGAIKGLEKIGPSVTAAALTMSENAMAGLAAPLQAGSLAGVTATGATVGTAGGGGQGGVVVYQTNLMQQGADVGQFSTEVSRNLAQRLSSGTSTLPVSQGSIQQGMIAPGAVFGVSGM